MEPLRVACRLRGHPIEGLSLVALGTVTKCIVILLRPVVTVVFTHQLRVNSLFVCLITQFGLFNGFNTVVKLSHIFFGQISIV